MTYLGIEANEYGTPTSTHECETCGVEFTVCPPIESGTPGWESCLDIDCPSYDPERDVDRMFDEEPWRIRQKEDWE